MSRSFQDDYKRRVEEHFMKAEAFLSLKEKGRPKRNEVIGDDDLLNLKIALETSTNLMEFFEVT